MLTSHRMTGRFLVAVALPLLAGSWVVALVSAPALASRSAGRAISPAIYVAGSLVCHQRAERSFHVGAAQLPVCARCLGLYVGTALGSFAWSTAAPLLLLSLSGWRRAVSLAAVPILLTAFVEWTTIAGTSNVVRFASALPFGLVVAGFVANVTARD